MNIRWALALGSLEAGAGGYSGDPQRRGHALLRGLCGDGCFRAGL